METVVLVDPDGRRVGTEGKLRAHRDGGLLHLAFCVFVFGTDGRLLLQQRAQCKYHFPGLWSNSCCGHPRPDEAVVAAGERRLGEELGFTTRLRPVERFIYHADDEVSGLSEHELAHVLVGIVAEAHPAPDPAEIDAWRWASAASLASEIEAHPERFTPWFRHIVTSYPVAEWCA